jgi:hypothetical protein
MFYEAADQNLIAVPVKSGTKFEAGAPKSLFRVPLTSSADILERHTYTVSNDGQRFLMAAAAGGGKSPPITVVVNWQAALKR